VFIEYFGDILGCLEQAEVLNFARSNNIDSKLCDFHFVVFLEDAVEVVGTPESILKSKNSSPGLIPASVSSTLEW
jgi:hypothetical protein